MKLDLNPTKARCKGAVFKANVHHFRTERGFAFSVRLNKLKRKSCPGCDSCAWQSDSFSEIGDSWPILGIEKTKHEELYILESCNESKDWETGHIDSWDLKLTPLYEPLESQDE